MIRSFDFERRSLWGICFILTTSCSSLYTLFTGTRSGIMFLSEDGFFTFFILRKTLASLSLFLTDSQFDQEIECSADDSSCRREKVPSHTHTIISTHMLTQKLMMMESADLSHTHMYAKSLWISSSSTYRGAGRQRWIWLTLAWKCVSGVQHHSSQCEWEPVDLIPYLVYRSLSSSSSSCLHGFPFHQTYDASHTHTHTQSPVMPERESEVSLIHLWYHHSACCPVSVGVWMLGEDRWFFERELDASSNSSKPSLPSLSLLPFRTLYSMVNGRVASHAHEFMSLSLFSRSCLSGTNEWWLQCLLRTGTGAKFA